MCSKSNSGHGRSSQPQSHGSCPYLHKMGPIHIPHGWEHLRPPFTHAHWQLMVAGRLVFFTGVINCPVPANHLPTMLMQLRRSNNRKGRKVSLCWRHRGFSRRGGRGRKGMKTMAIHPLYETAKQLKILSMAY